MNSIEKMHYETVYANSKQWEGQSYKTLVVYCEQGIGDTIQFARYFKYLKNRVIIHCDLDLHKLFKNSFKNCEYLDKNCIVLPKHDYHVRSMDLPFILNKYDFGINPYLSVDAAFIEPGYGTKIGIAWEGNPLNERNLERSCPLNLFKNIKGSFFSLQPEIFNSDLLNGCEEFDLNGYEPMDNWYDTAKLIQAMDIVISVDTGVLHLAGALGKRCFALLDYNCDERWDYNWYSNMTFCKQLSPGDWESAFDYLNGIIKI